MCGITGVFAFSNKGHEFLPKVETATDTMSRRGPDSSGVFAHNSVALGHRRLAILDVSDAAAQPFTSNCGRYSVVFNGEVYNFKKLKEELLADGYRFRSESDTEVLVEAYARYGISFIEKLNGFFAFALYDSQEETLLVVRDRVGIKPLLFCLDEDKLIFASEMKAIMAYGVERDIDFTSLFQYLQLNYIPASASIFKSVKKLAPGTFQVYNNKGLVQESSYYQLPEFAMESESPSYDEAKSRLKDLLSESVKARMISDVPLGAFLSGGVDSSVIVALAARQTKHLNTFSIGFADEPYFDETEYALEVARMYNTNHHVFSLTNDDLFGHFDRIINSIDEPFADSSAIAFYILSHETRKHVTVALSGDGADEIFGGYNKHKAEWMARHWGWKNTALKVAHPLFRSFPQSRNSAMLNKLRQLDRYTAGLQFSDADRYWRWCSFVGEEQALSTITSQFASNGVMEEYSTRKAELVKSIGLEGNMNDIFRTDIGLVLQNDMLTKVDLMSMANSLEVRVPFLDHEVLNYVFSLPPEYKIGNEGGKLILKEAFKDMLPSNIFTRSKHGFEVPLLKWFRNELKSMIVDDLLEDEFIRDQGIFNPDVIAQMKKQLFSFNPGEVHARIWALVVFQHWYKRFVC